MNEGAGVWLFASMAISRAAMRFSVVWENPMATCEMKVGMPDRNNTNQPRSNSFRCFCTAETCGVCGVLPPILRFRYVLRGEIGMDGNNSLFCLFAALTLNF